MLGFSFCIVFPLLEPLVHSVQ